MDYEIIVDEFKRLKNEKEAAYRVFKHNPSIANASGYTKATQAYTDFCVRTVETLVYLPEDDKHDEIIEHFDEYKTCKQCEAKVLYKIDADHYIESSDFLKDFPGWCYNCLVDHCTETECEACIVTSDPANCSFKETRELYLQNKD